MPRSQPFSSLPPPATVDFDWSRLTISGTAKSPSPITTSENPSTRYNVPNVYLGSPVIWARPIVPMTRPITQLARPFRKLAPVNAPIIRRARMIKRNCSPKPKDMISGFAKKIETLRIIAPNNPPTRDERKAADSALDASPFLAKGCPSKTVACEPAVPGIPNKTAGKVSEVVVGARTPIIIAKATLGSKV